MNDCVNIILINITKFSEKFRIHVDKEIPR